MKIFISYHSRYRDAAAAVVEALRVARPEHEVFFDQQALRSGFWLPQLHEAVAKADAFVFLFGEVVGSWQAPEYYGAFDRRVKEPQLPIVPVLMGKASAPGLPFFNQLQWLQTDAVAGPESIARILDGLERGPTAPAQKLWRLVNPYRGLQALREEDAALLYGRDALVGQLLTHIGGRTDRVTIAVGNSGVGKSSLVYAGIFAALARQHWPADAWPATLKDSRMWSRLAFKPGEKPLRELARGFVGQWRDPKSVEYAEEAEKWARRLAEADDPLDDLIHAADRWAEEQGLMAPARHVLYIDQAEELYTRADRAGAERLSAILKRAAANERLVVLMSLRADFYGKLQDDTALFAASEKVDVPKLDEPGFRAVVTGPAKLLGATFEEGLADELVKAAVAQPVGLPLLSYQLTEMWREMAVAEQGVLRWPKRRDPTFDLARALVENADGYLKKYPEREDAVRRLFCVKLVHVPEQGAPTRRIALQSDLDAGESAIAQDLSGPDYRLLAAGETDNGKPSIEVGHEALLSAWERLKNWIADRRGFYAWATRLELDRRDWEAAGKPDDALLSGRALDIARGHRAAFAPDLRAPDTAFIEASEAAQSARLATEQRREREQVERERFWTRVALTVGTVATIVVLWLALAARSTENEALIAQSRFLARDAKTLALAGDAETALLLARAALPYGETRDRPIVSAALQALLQARLELRVRSVLRGHEDIVWSASFSSDGTRVVTASSDKTVRLWDAATGREIAVLRGHEGIVSSASFSPGGARVVTAADDKTARLWGATTGKAIAVLRGHESRVLSASFSPDGARVVTASGDNTARLWDATTGKEAAVLRGHAAYVWSASFSQDGALVVTASGDNTARLWDATTGKETAVLRGHEGSVSSASFSPDGTCVVTASWDNTARLWSVVTGKETAVLRGHEGFVLSASFSPDGARVVTTSSDNTARLWDATTGKEIVALRGHEHGVSSASFSPDGARVVTAAYGKTARLWDAEMGTEIAVLRGHEGIVWSASFSPDGTRVATASGDNTARLWDATTGKETSVLRGHEGSVSSASFSPDGAHVVTAADDKTARLWDATTGKETAVLRGHEGSVSSASFSPDGAHVVTAADDKTARLWDATTGKETMVLHGHEYGVSSASFSPDGTRVVTASTSTARLWDATTGKEIAVLRGGHGGDVRSASFSPDGARVVTASDDRTARLWDATTGKETMVLHGHEYGVSSASFSPDGARVVTASDDRTARLWDATTGKETAVLRGHEGSVSSASFSPDGEHVVTAADDKTARLWDATTGKEIVVLHGHEYGVSSASFSPDGTRVVTASNDRTVRAWNVDMNCRDLIAWAGKTAEERHLQLSRAQREKYFLPPDDRRSWRLSRVLDWLIPRGGDACD